MEGFQVSTTVSVIVDMDILVPAILISNINALARMTQRKGDAIVGTSCTSTRRFKWRPEGFAGIMIVNIKPQVDRSELP